MTEVKRGRKRERELQGGRERYIKKERKRESRKE